MAYPALDEGHLLLACLAVAVRAHDPVLVAQVAEKADKVLGESQFKRSFRRLPSYGVRPEDLAWLATAEI